GSQIEAIENLSLSEEQAQAFAEGSEVDQDYVLRVNFNFNGAKVGMAYFSYAGWEWIIFDQKVNFNIPLLAEEIRPQIHQIESIQNNSLTILRFQKQSHLFTRLSNFENSWNLDLVTQEIADSQQQSVSEISSTIIDDEGYKTLHFKFNEPSRVFAFTDPLSGLPFLGITSYQAMESYPSQNQYSDFEIFKTLQGVVLLSHSENHRLDFENDIYVLSSPDNLYVSSSASGKIGKKQDEQINRIFDWAIWQGDSDIMFRVKSLQHKKNISEIPKGQRNKLRLNFARFLASYGYGHEAQSILNVVTSDNPILLLSRQIKAFQMALDVLTHNYDDALELFERHDFSNIKEMLLWKAVALYYSDQQEEAEQLFLETENILLSYPVYMRNKILLVRIKSLLAQDKQNDTRVWIEEIKPYQEYLNPFEQAELKIYLSSAFSKGFKY
ncbi:MAG: hypothetical protein AAF403_08290, partial [Pseudomonadota bacterium]